MRRFLVLSAGLTGLLFPAPAALADRLWALQLSGGSVVLSLDPPEERGRVLVFHRHPDGVFSSVRADEVRRVTIAQGPAKKPRRSLDGVVLVFGRDADGPDPETWRERAPQPPPPPPPAQDFGYDDGYGYGSGSPALSGGTRGGRHRRHVHPLARPNGFPAVSPPGSPGATQPPIGPNGFPILFPTPPPAFRSGPPQRRR